MTSKLVSGLVAILLVSACASARPSAPPHAQEAAMDALRRARDLHWSVQVYHADSVHAEGRASLLSDEGASVGGVDVAYAGIDSIYRWSPDVSSTSKAATLTGALVFGGLGVLLSGICYDDQPKCALVFAGAGATIGAFLGASVGGMLSPSVGAWEPFWVPDDASSDSVPGA